MVPEDVVWQLDELGQVVGSDLRSGGRRAWSGRKSHVMQALAVS